MHKLLLCSLCFWFSTVHCFGQKNYGVQQDYYTNHETGDNLVPQVYYQTKNNWYGMARYNYENEQTVSVHIGKVFSKEGRISYSIIPLAGIVAGKFTGVSAGTQAKFETGKFSLFTEPSYCVSFKNKAQNFVYAWTELTLQPVGFFYAGVAVQQTKVSGEAMFTEPGVVAALTIGQLEVPVYFFNKKGAQEYFVVGLHWKLEK